VIVKLYFQHHNTSLQCHMIPQKSFLWDDLMLKKHIQLLSMLKIVVQVNSFEETKCIFFQGFFNG